MMGEKYPLGTRKAVWIPEIPPEAMREYKWFNAFNDETNHYTGTYQTHRVDWGDAGACDVDVWYKDEDGDMQYTIVERTSLYDTRKMALVDLLRAAEYGVTVARQTLNRAREWRNRVRSQVEAETK